MRVLYFGTYERGYPRNAQVISCLRRAGVDVVEHHVGVWEERRDHWRAGLGTVARLASAEVQLLRRPQEDFDVVVVGYPGHFDLPAARRTAGGRPVVFNPLVSLADTFVSDRRRFQPGTAPARILAGIDRLALGAAERLVSIYYDTPDQALRRARVALRREPGGPPVEQVGPGEAEEQNRCVGDPAGEVLDQVEERRLGPVDVFEDEDERPSAPERLGELSQGPERLLSAAGLARRAGRTQHALDDEVGVR